MGDHNTIFSVIFMLFNIPGNVKISTNTNDTYRNVYFFRHILEFLSIRIQMRPHLQNNIHKSLYSRTFLRNHRTNLLDYCTLNV
jgi:hypothetical protein